MAKRISVILVLLIGLAMISTDAYCRDLDDKLEAGAYGILVVPAKDNFDTTGGGGGYLRYYVTDNIAIEGAAEYAQWDFAADTAGATGQLTGTLDVIPIMGTILYAAEVGHSVRGYIGGGVTGMLVNGSATGTLTPGGTGKIEFDDGIGGHICAGLDWQATKNIILNLDGKYTWLTSDTVETVDSGTLTFEDMDMDNFTLRGGATYKF